MPRNPRKQSPYDIYHVMLRGVGRMRIFEDEADRLFLLSGIHKYSVEEGCSILAWCLMDNHVHLLLHTPLQSMAKFIKRVSNKYVYYFNRRYDRVGHLFQNRYKSIPIDSEAYFLTVVRYIHRNPIRERITDSLDWKWSSYREYIRAPFLSDTTYALGVFGGKKQFVEFHMADDVQALTALSNSPSSSEYSGDAVAKRAAEAIGSDAVRALSSLNRQKRDENLRLLKQAGLSIRQIERLTGIGRWIIAQA